MNNNLETFKGVVISTMHLTCEEAELSGLPYSPLPGFDRAEGSLVYVCDLEDANWDKPGPSKGWDSLHTAAKWAKGLGFDWIMFDCDGPLVDDLEKYEW